jgi:hypothetical protein
MNKAIDFWSFDTLTPWSFGALIWVLWAAYVFYSLKHPGANRKRLLKNIRKAKPGRYYRSLLSRCLDYTAIHWFSVSLILWVPEHWLKLISKGWKKNQMEYDLRNFIYAWGYLSIVSPLALIAPLALLGSLVWLLLETGSGNQLGNWLLTSAWQIAVVYICKRHIFAVRVDVIVIKC